MVDAQTACFSEIKKIGKKVLADLESDPEKNAVVHPPSDDAILKLGRANTSCKECLALLLTTSTLLLRWKATAPPVRS